MRLLDDAESPESPTLAEAKKKLDFAIEYSDEPWPLYWTFARIQSCQGNLDGALITLREVQTKCPENVRLHLDLAMLHIRMGANYFSSAIDCINQIGDDIGEKHLWLAYLLAFLGENEKAHREFERYTHLGGREWESLCRAHLLLIQGASAEATAIAERHLQEGTDRGETNNWAELLICAEEFDRALALLESPKKRKRSEPETNALLALTRHLSNPTESLVDREVKESWRDVDAWGFKELVLFRERVKRQGKDGLATRLGIIEPLIQQQELQNLRTRRRMFGFGPRGVAWSIQIPDRAFSVIAESV